MPEDTRGKVVARELAGFTGAGRSKLGNMSTTFATNSGPFFWRRYSHLQGKHVKY